MKGWGGQTLVHLGEAPSREGLGGVQPLSIWEPPPSREGLGGVQLFAWSWQNRGNEIGRQHNVNGTFSEFGENQLSASWKGTPAKS